MKTIVTFLIVIVGLFAVGLLIKHKKAQSKAASTPVTEQAAQAVEAAKAQVKTAAERISAVIPDKSVSARPEGTQPKSGKPVTHLQRLLQGEVPVARNMTATGEPIAIPSMPNLSRLLAAETSNSNR
ncbi:hypothetical protein [Lacunisphaera limnophila]|uniref:hypothetical protein n=1 Tax=Lacunisphaera limnophila TaxID=1838286 RepID=UPI0008599A1F|nr:hypothetical protein [Lacunisphaera limnophila]